MTVIYNNDIEKEIISHLDGWVVYTVNDDDTEEETVATRTAEVTEQSGTENETNDGEVQPFIDDITVYADNPNKKVDSAEVKKFYDIALEKAYIYTNRLNVDDLSSIEEARFISGVCLLAASDLWNKYNIRVNNEDMEDTYVQSYGGLLYKQAVNVLNGFINQRITSLTSLKKQSEQCNTNNTSWYI